MTYKDSQAKLVEYQRREEQQRKNYAENHKGPCVPWRGLGGEIGRCIYCGKTHTFNNKQASFDTGFLLNN